MTLYFTVLGPIGVSDRGQPVRIDRPRRRATLAYLLLNANQVVSIDQMTTAIWGADPPSTARAQIQSEISALRRVLPSTAGATGQIGTRPGGYRFDVAHDQLDLTTYMTLAGQARADADRHRLEEAATVMRKALALWHGPVLAGAVGGFVERSREYLEQVRLADMEWLFEIELSLGRHRGLIAELSQQVAQLPLRERLRSQLMIALYRDGRQSEALHVARQGREILLGEHGLDPAPLLRELELAVLRQDPTLDLAATSASAGPGGTVSVPAPATATPADRPSPAQLPAASPIFAGRQAELVSLAERLRGDDQPGQGAAARIVVLHGMPGVGTSALGLQAAHAAADAYPDGQLCVDCSATGHGPGAVLAGFLRALGIAAAAIPEAVSERSALFRSATAHRRMLILLDGVSSVDQVQPLIPAAAGCTVLITTRHLLDLPGAYRQLVAPLTEADGLAVLTGYLGAARVAAEPDAAQRLLRVCGCLPLALRLASSRLHSGRSIADLVTLLRDPTHRLDELSAGEVSVRATLESSYRTLSEPAKLVLRRVAALPTPSIPDWAPAVCTGLAPRVAVRATDELVGCHLLTPVPRHRPGPRHYTLHELVRCYASSIVVADDDPEPPVPVGPGGLGGLGGRGG